MNDLLMLAMLLGAPKYGYQLKREAGWMMGQDTLHNNLVYPMLRRFVERKWVSKKAVPGERGQTRQLYAMTVEGHRWLFNRINQFSESEAASEDAFHIRVGLFAALKPEARKNILAMRESYLQSRDKELSILQSKMDLGKFGTEIVKHMRKQIEMECNWIRRLHQMAKAGNRRKVSQ
jgi:DNA-binding PadR family transcriptional regulator